MKLDSTTLWLGSEASHSLYETVLARVTALELLGPEAVKAAALQVKGVMFGADGKMELPPLYDVKDGLAVLRIEGPLIAGSAGIMSIFGITGYDDIKQAAAELAANKDVKAVLQLNNSPGGDAAGCEECANALAELGAVKPMVTYTDLMMASGGYWLGSTGQKILTSKTSILGSIGVIGVLTSYAEALKKDGIEKKVVRAGEYKQLANSNEPISEAAIAQTKARAEDMYSIFADGVAARLGVTRENFDATMGRGREFMGQKAVDVGLAHQVASYDQAAAYAKKIDRPKLSRQNSRNSKEGSNMKATLSNALILALAAGAAASSLDFTVAAATVEGVAPDAEGQQFLRAQAVELEAGLKVASQTAVTAATAPLQAEVGNLKATIATKDTELQALRTSTTAVTEKAQQLETAVTSCEKVLSDSMACMQIALGGKAVETTLKGAALVAEHDKVRVEFDKKFPGAKVSVTAAEIKKSPDANPAALPDFAVIARRQLATREGAKA